MMIFSHSIIERKKTRAKNEIQIQQNVRYQSVNRLQSGTGTMMPKINNIDTLISILVQCKLTNNDFIIYIPVSTTYH